MVKSITPPLGPDWPCYAACSAGSVSRRKLIRAFASPPRSLHPRPRAGCDRVATIWRPSGIRDPGRAPYQLASPRCQTRRLCLESVAFPDSIMDDKSMQQWINSQLTVQEPAWTIRLVGRPKEPTSPAAYRTAFFKRVRAARALYTDDPPEMAKALGVEKGTYYRYETRTMLPHHLIPKFCAITGVTTEWLINGPSAVRAAMGQQPTIPPET
jgi:hypothetical protein